MLQAIVKKGKVFTEILLDFFLLAPRCLEPLQKRRRINTFSFQIIDRRLLCNYKNLLVLNEKRLYVLSICFLTFELS